MSLHDILCMQVGLQHIVLHENDSSDISSLDMPEALEMAAIPVDQLQLEEDVSEQRPR